MLLGLFAELPVTLHQIGMQVLQMVLERALSGECTATEGAFKGLQSHVHALSVVLQVRDRLESLSAVSVGATIGTNSALDVRQHVAFQVLLLLERFVAAGRRALEPAAVALQVPVQLALADELLVDTDVALEL